MIVYIKRPEENKFHADYNSELKPFLTGNRIVRVGDSFMGYIYKYTVVKVGRSRLNEPAAYCIIENMARLIIILFIFLLKGRVVMFKYEFWIFTSKYKNYHEYRTYKTEKTSMQLSGIAKKYATKVARKQGTEIMSCGYRYPNSNKYYFEGGVSVGA